MSLKVTTYQKLKLEHGVSGTEKRIATLDIARGLSVLIMIMVHTLWMYGSVETQAESLVGTFLHILGKGTAAFLVLMGFSMAISRNQSPWYWFRRGLLLFSIGCLLNTLKFIVPIAIFKTMPDSFVAAYGWQLPLSFKQWQFLFLTGDILQFAGVSLIIMALIAPVLRNTSGILLAIVFITITSGELRGWEWSLPGFNYLSQLLFSATYQVYFPVFPWITCILSGLVFGRLFLQWDGHQKNTFDRMAVVGVLGLMLGGSLMLWNFSYHFNNFFHIGPGGILYLIGLNFIGLRIIFQFDQAIVSSRLGRLLVWCSERVTSLYGIQWTLICWGMGVIGYQTLTPAQLLSLIPVTVSLTLLLQWLIDRLLRRKRNGSLVAAKS